MKRFYIWWLLAISIYIGVACFAYALRHPEMTDTERLVRLKEAVLWR